MTKKDYEAIAAGIAEVMSQIRLDVDAGWGHLIEADAVAIGIADNLAHYFAKDNPHFDKEEFLAASDVVNLIPSESFRAV